MAGSAFRPGTLLAGRFSLDDLLGEVDGAGLWRATDRVLARSVSVHVLADSDPRADALLTAARRSALVTDAHLLRVLDAATADGVVYVVAEWGSGVSLDRMLAEGPLSPRRAAWVVKEVAEAIATAHRNQVAHGRLLPESVLISETGSVKLIGFAVDAVLRADTPEDPRPRRVTDGERVSATDSDVLNLGALLYATLVGRWPGTEGSVVPSAPTEHGRPLRPRQVRAGVPRPLDAICERVLGTGSQTVPLETAHEVYAALSDYIGEPGAGAPGAVPPLGDTLGQPAGDPLEDSTVAVEPTALLDTGRGTAGRGPDTADGPGGGVETDSGGDLESTQAGVPVFSEGDSDGEWVPGASGAEARSGAVRHAPAPPPPFADLPERPLFADGPWAADPRDDAPDTDDTGSVHAGRTTGAGNGALPPRWGPDADEPSDSGAGWSDHDDAVPGRRWLWLAIVVALVLAVVVAVVVVIGLPGSPQRQADDRPTSRATTPTPSARIPVAAVSDFDPEGDPPSENPDEAKLATDGDPATAWRTLTYRGNPKLGGLKSGVGLLLDLGKAHRVGGVRLTLIGSPTSVQVLAAPGATAAPTSADSMRKVAGKDGAGTTVNLSLAQPVTTRWLAVWLTSLPSAAGGYQGQVAEISVRS